MNIRGVPAGWAPGLMECDLLGQKLGLAVGRMEKDLGMALTKTHVLLGLQLVFQNSRQISNIDQLFTK